MKKFRIVLLISVLIICFVGTIFAEASPDNNAWSKGTYKRTNYNKYEFSTLEIIDISDDSFQFKLRSNSGTNTGLVKGIAYINDNTAKFDDSSGGVLYFTISGDTIEIAESNRMFTYSGMGPYFAGNYIDVQKIKTPVATTIYFTELKIFKDDQEQEFIRLVGDNYQKFTDYAHLLPIHEPDLDNMGARVHPMFVRGMGGFMEAIIMIRDSDNAIWAAVIDGNKVLYFTNTEDTEFVPITISRWHDRFKNKPIQLVK